MYRRISRRRLLTEAVQLSIAGALAPTASEAAVATAAASVARSSRVPDQSSTPESSSRTGFHLEEASIRDIQRAIMAHQITSVGLVELYLKRIKAYNGVCVNEPMGILG